MSVDVKSYIRSHERMLSGRLNYERDWRQISECMAPAKQSPLRYTETPGERKTNFIYHSEGMTAPTKLSASLQGNLVNPAQKWQSLRVWPLELNQINEVQNACEFYSQTIDWSISSSNFGNVAGEFLQELPTFGTGCMLRWVKQPRGPGQGARLFYESVPIGTYCFQEDEEGVVDTLVRKAKLSLRQAFLNWKEKIGVDLMKEYRKTPDAEYTFVNWIQPRRERNPSKSDRANMPFENVWILEDKELLIHEGSLKRNPIICARWRKATGELWGTGQGHLALPDVKTLNRYRELKLLAGAQDVAPTWFALQGAIVGELIQEPAAINWEKQTNSVRTMTSGARVDMATLAEQELVQTIRQVFFIDQIEALPPLQEGPPGGMSPLEIAKRYEQMYKMLGPMYGRLTTEFLKPVVEGAFLALWDVGMLPPPPREMQGAELHIQYEGPLARAQRGEDLSGIMTFLNWAGEVEKLTGNREAMDLVDLDDMGLTVAQVSGVPARITRGKEVIAQVREARAKREEAMAQAQAMMATAQAAGKAVPMIKALQGGQTA